MKPISALDLKRIHEFFWSGYDPNDQKYAKSLCSKCRNDLSKVALGKMDRELLPKPNLQPRDFGGLTGRQLKDKIDCMCTSICKIARDHGGVVGNTAAKKAFPLGGQATASFLAKNPQPQPQAIKTCDFCGQKIGRGIRHHCNATTRRNSAEKLLENDQRGREQVASSVIREKVAENPTAPNIQLQTRGGAKAMSIPNPKAATKSKAPYASQPIPAEEYRTLATAIGLSNNQLEQLGTGLRSLKGKDIVEPNAMPKVRSMDRDLDRFYTAKKVLVDSSDPNEEDFDENGKVERWMFYAPEVPELVKYLEGKRYHPRTRTFIKVYMDGGQSWFKVCMTLEKVQDDLASPGKRKTRSSYSDGVLPGKFKDSGVKKIIPLAFIQKASESYDNLELVLKELGLHRLDYTPCFDMKLGLVFMGLGTAASSFPCIWCKLAKKDFGDLSKMFTGGDLRTLQEIHDLAAKYLEEVQANPGATRKLSSKDYFSCEHAPLFNSELGDKLTKLVIELVPPMELHIFLGMGNALFKQLQEGMNAMFWKSTLTLWMKQINVKQSKHHGGQFNGNSMVRVSQGVNQLRTLLGRDLQKSQKLALVIKTLQQLDAVRESCFGQTLDDDFEKEIRILGELWLKLGMSVTPKAHALFAHVAQFLHFKNPQDGPKRGLGYWSEHTGESVHHDFEVFWERGYKRQLDSPDYMQKSLECISTYAARHV